jgi:hypothetical protein
MPLHYTELLCRLNLKIAEKNVFLLVLNVRLSVPGGLVVIFRNPKAASAMYCAEKSARKKIKIKGF